MSGADPGTGGGTSLSTDLAHWFQEEYGYDIVHVEVNYADSSFGSAGAARDEDTAFSSLEVQEVYFEWRRKVIAGEMEEFRRGEDDRDCRPDAPCPI